MTMKQLSVALIAAGVCSMSAGLSAHHGSSGYDNDHMTVAKATLTEFVWAAPHSQVKFDTTDDKGVITHWNIEAPPPTMLTERGWNKSSLKIGWVVTMYFNAAKSGAPVGIMRKAVLPDGKELWAYPPPELIEKLTTAPK
jgi:hypothetical protein